MFSLKKLAGVAAIAAAGLVLSACSGPTADNSNTSASGSSSAAAPSTGGPLKVAVVTHGSAGDAFWNVVKNGAEQAGKDLNVGVDYFSDGDPGKNGILGAKDPHPFEPNGKWRVFYTQQHGDNTTWEVVGPK